MIDAETKKALYVTEAYETITGRSCQSLMENPSSYEELIHAEDRVHVLAKLGEATQTGHFDERFRILRARGEVRWVTVHGFPVRDAAGKIQRLVGTARDITPQKEAEDKVAEHLAAAESARAESDALNKATLALTADLRMDFVLDRLLESLLELVPCECARVLLLEGDSQLLVAREKLRHEVPKKTPDYPLTLDAADSPFLLRILTAQNSVLLADTKDEKEWPSFKGHTNIRSWLCVPLVASQQTLGLLSVGHTEPNTFTQDHLRRTQLLSIPAAAAIQNSRLYERAEIFGSELQRRLTDLRQTEKALEQSEEGRRVDELRTRHFAVLLLRFFSLESPFIEFCDKKLCRLCDELVVELSNLDENSVEPISEIIVLWVTDEDSDSHPVGKLEVNIFVGGSRRFQEDACLGRQVSDDLAECVRKEVVDGIVANVLEMQRMNFPGRPVFQQRSYRLQKGRIGFEDSIHTLDEIQSLVKNGSVEEIKVHPVADTRRLIALEVTDCGVEERQRVYTTCKTDEFRKSFPVPTLVENLRSAED